MSNKASKNLVPLSAGRTKRPPVIVVMGHIDHGKSTLLDYIRKTDIVSGEAGGITQHVGTYQAEHTGPDGSKRQITFLDTPGHEAFCSIRERGAKAADIAILVVSAEDGVKPQTVEAYKEIQKSNIPFIVAITKTDKPNADIDKAKTTLGEHEIYVEGWGGDVPCVAVSATTGAGMDELLDMVMLIADMADLDSDPTLSATGIVIESELDKRKGVSATLLIKDGTLKTGNFVVAGSAFAPVRYIEDFKGDKIEQAGASVPVRIIGWSAIPACGALFEVERSKKDAERTASQNAAAARTAKIKSDNEAVTAPNSRGEQVRKAADKLTPAEREQQKSNIAVLPIVLKADVIGSLEGVERELGKLHNDKAAIKIVSTGVGEINENDVKLAQGDPEIILVGFNVTPDKKAAAMIERSAPPITMASFKVIYELSKFVGNALLKKVPKEYIEETTGRAKILAIFSKEKDRQVVGGKVESGAIESGSEVRIIRRDAEIGRGKVRELQSKKLRVEEVAQGFEFGMMVEAKIELAQGDRVEAVRTVEKQ